MRLLGIPVGNAFRYDLGVAVKVNEGQECDVIPCLDYGLLNLKRLVLPIGKVEKYWFAKHMEQEEFKSVRAIEWGMIVKVPHRAIEYLVTCGVSMKGVIVAKLGQKLKMEQDVEIKDLGYAGEHIGLKVIE